MIDTLINAALNNPDDLLIWSHGFLAALALRRGRIETILDKVIPVDGGPDDEKN